MRNTLQNLLIFLAMCLCALVALQWHREAGLRRELRAAAGTARNQSETIRTLQNQLQLAEAEAKRVGQLRASLAAAAESNRLEIGALKQQLAAARAQVERDTERLEQFKAALQQANDNIRRQNESLRTLAEERNEAVRKFNALVEKYNNLVTHWNARPPAGTNAPPRD
jgi:chromosome segregation ATPase